MLAALSGHRCGYVGRIVLLVVLLVPLVRLALFLIDAILCDHVLIPDITPIIRMCSMQSLSAHKRISQGTCRIRGGVLGIGRILPCPTILA